jgi:hypothetical protein
MTNSNLTIINVKQLVGILPKEDLILAGVQLKMLLLKFVKIKSMILD